MLAAGSEGGTFTHHYPRRKVAAGDIHTEHFSVEVADGAILSTVDASVNRDARGDIRDTAVLERLPAIE